MNGLVSTIPIKPVTVRKFVALIVQTSTLQSATINSDIPIQAKLYDV